jgi:chromosome segregation protein
VTEDPASSLDDRVSELEGRVDEIQADKETESPSVDDLQAQMQTIKKNQSDIEDSLESLVHRIQEDEKITPHIEAVEGLYDSLSRIDENMVEMREKLEELNEEIDAK